MDKFFLVLMFLLVLAVPVHAADPVGGILTDGVSADTNQIVSLAEYDSVPSQEVSQEAAALAGDDLFAGGYWFVCDCALGYDLTFYVPADWADGQFTLSSSGAPVNMSNSTVYAYCPSFPNYTFSAARFSEFTYRSTNPNSNGNLLISELSDSNIDFLDDGSRRLSDYQLQVLGCTLMLFVFAALIFKRG